jgi:hypothetical protein
MPWHGMPPPCHPHLWPSLDRTTMSNVFLSPPWTRSCTPLTKTELARVSTRTPKRAQACPCTRQCVHGERPGRARTRCASSPQQVPRHQLLHVDSPQHQDPARHCHEPSRALSQSRRTTTSATVPRRRVTLATMLDHRTLFRAHRDVP